MNDIVIMNKQELFKMIDLLHKQLLLDSNILFSKGEYIKDIMGNKFLTEVSRSCSVDDNINPDIYDFEDLYRFCPHIITIETIIHLIFRTLAKQDEKIKWCFIANNELSVTLSDIEHKTSMPYAITFFRWLYFENCDFEKFIDNMYSYLTNELNVKFIKLKSAFNEDSSNKYIEECSPMFDI